MVDGAAVRVRDEGAVPTPSLMMAPHPLPGSGPPGSPELGLSNNRTTYKRSIYVNTIVSIFLE